MTVTPFLKMIKVTESKTDGHIIGAWIFDENEYGVFISKKLQP